MVPPPAPAPRTTVVATKETPDTLVSGDKSLDEVILAYLSQGEGQE
jgi:hypothetical protein